MTFAEELTPQERDKLLAEIMAKITPKKKPPRSGCARQTRTCATTASHPTGASAARSRTALRGQGQRASESAATRNLSF